MTSTGKYGADALGSWERDENSLPCYALDLSRLSELNAPLFHLLGTGCASLLADPQGRLRLFSSSPDEAVCLCASRAAACSSFYVQIEHGSASAAFFPGSLPVDGKPRMDCGIGYVRYTGDLLVGEASLGVVVDILAPLGKPYFLAVVSVTPPGKEELKLKIRFQADLNIAPAGALDAARRDQFLKDGIAILGGLRQSLGDAFLAAGDSWEATVRGDTLCLEHTVNLQGGKAWSDCCVFGFSDQCSVDWLRQQVNTGSPASIRARWSEYVGSNRCRAPELWMQEECLWGLGRALALQVRLGDERRPLVVGGGEAAFGAALPGERQPQSVASRDVLRLALPLGDAFPDLALGNLEAVCRRQAASGRIPETLGQMQPRAEGLDAAQDRSDLELWFLVSWAQFLTLHPDLEVLDSQIPFVNGAEATAWDHICQAYSWIRDEVREGPHGLLRALAGDAAAFLNQMGAEGRGESVLNSAMACFALNVLVDIARRRGEDRRAEEMAGWLQKQRLAVGDAFDGRYFRRGYTDSGRPVGSLVEERVFTDVQAWAVLARCGTARQREQALDSVLAADIGPAVPVFSRAYPIPPPRDVSDCYLPAGDGGNGGVSMPTAACLVWALACEGRQEDALRQWERLSLRCRAADTEAASALTLSNVEECSSTLAGRRAGGVGFAGADPATYLPKAHAVAWQDFALRRIVS